MFELGCSSLGPIVDPGGPNQGVAIRIIGGSMLDHEGSSLGKGSPILDLEVASLEKGEGRPLQNK